MRHLGVFLSFILLISGSLNVARADEGGASIKVVRWVKAEKNKYFLEYGRLDSTGRESEVERRANYMLEDPAVDPSAAGQWMVEKQDWEILIPSTRETFSLVSQFNVGGRAYWTLRVGAPPAKPPAEEEQPKKKSRFKGALDDVKKHNDERTAAVKEQVTEANKDAAADLKKTGERRSELETKNAAARAKTDSANGAAAAQLANSVGNLATAMAQGKAAGNQGKGGGDYSIHTIWYCETYDASIQLGPPTAAEGRITGSSKEQYRYGGQLYYICWVDMAGLSRESAERAVAYGKENLPPTRRAEARITSGGAGMLAMPTVPAGAPGVDFGGSTPDLSTGRQKISNAISNAWGNTKDFAKEKKDKWNNSEMGQTINGFFEKLGKNAAKILAKKGDLQDKDVKKAADDALTDVALDQMFTMKREEYALFKGKSYKDLDKHEKVSVDFRILGETAPTYIAAGKYKAWAKRNFKCWDDWMTLDDLGVPAQQKKPVVP